MASFRGPGPARRMVLKYLCEQGSASLEDLNSRFWKNPYLYFGKKVTFSMVLMEFQESGEVRIDYDRRIVRYIPLEERASREKRSA